GYEDSKYAIGEHAESFRRPSRMWHGGHLFSSSTPVDILPSYVGYIRTLWATTSMPATQVRFPTGRCLFGFCRWLNETKQRSPTRLLRPQDRTNNGLRVTSRCARSGSRHKFAGLWRKFSEQHPRFL